MGRISVPGTGRASGVARGPQKGDLGVDFGTIFDQFGIDFGTIFVDCRGHAWYDVSLSSVLCCSLFSVFCSLLPVLFGAVFG